MNDRKTSSKSKRRYDVEEEHKKIVAQLKIDDYQLSRIPRAEDQDKGQDTSKSKRG
jgi:hypothetical protein